MWTVLAVALVVLGAAVAGAQFAPDVRDALGTAKKLYVATKRADGSTSKVAPIWFMFDGDAVYFTTVPGSYKAKRIAKGSPVLVWVGSSRDRTSSARARSCAIPRWRRRWPRPTTRSTGSRGSGFFRPRPDRVRDGKTVIVRVTPLPAGS